MAGVTDILRRRGLLTWLLAANGTVFVLMSVALIVARTGNPWGASLPALLELPASFGLWLHRPWTLFTYMFTHEGFLHLLFNMLWLLWFGDILLHRVSQRTLLWLYIGGGLAGGVLYMICLPLLPELYGMGSPLLLGASASVLALMAANAVLMPDYTLHLFFIGDVKLKWMAVAMIVLCFLGLGGGNAAGGIAHVGGLAAGLAAGLALRRKPAQKRPQEPRRKNPFRGMEPGSFRMQAHNAPQRERADAERLDALLDKIHVSGFNSLTHAERAELEALSKKITK